MINWIRVALITGIVILLFALSHKGAKWVYYRGYYTGCNTLAEDRLFNAKDQEYLLFKCNYYTKKKMKEWGDVEEVLVDSDVWPDRGE